jgi:hypothetical protein
VQLKALAANEPDTLLGSALDEEVAAYTHAKLDRCDPALADAS